MEIQDRVAIVTGAARGIGRATAVALAEAGARGVVLVDVKVGELKETERLERFDREAKLLGSLNHPNIATIHGLHQADSIKFLAMELVSGEDLAERIARGPLALDEALEIARSTALALPQRFCELAQRWWVRYLVMNRSGVQFSSRAPTLQQQRSCSGYHGRCRLKWRAQRHSPSRS